MKSFFKKLAFVMAMAMVVSMAAPAAQRAAAATEFTYAEQESGDKVTALTMKVGDKVDLKFIGVRDYRNYTLQWVSSNEAVATVDKNGVITAVADGTARVELQVGDGTDYTSTPVVVTVGEVMNVTLGTPENKSITEHTLKVGESIDLNFYGVKDWAADKYACTWVSTNESVATVDKMGNVEALEAGTTRVTVVIQNKETGAVLAVTPVEFTVATDEVTPTPVPTSGSFEVHQTSTKTVELVFETEPENVTVDTLEVNWLISDLEVGLSAKSVTTNGNVVTVVLNDNFTNGDSYVFRYNNTEATLVASAGEIVSVGLSYYTDDETDGAGKAYVSTDDETATTVLVPHFYDASGVDVTALYDISDFDISYELATTDDRFDLVDNELTFNAISQAVVSMSVTWVDDEGNPMSLVSLNNPIIAVKRPPITFSILAGGFVAGDGGSVDDDDREIFPLDDFMTNPESVFWTEKRYSNTWTAGDDNTSLQFAALLKDSRGNMVVTGMLQGEEKGEYPYGHFTFASSKESVFDVDESGMLGIHEGGTANVLVYFVPANADDEDAEKVLIGGTKITVKAEPYVYSYKMLTDTQSKLIATVKTGTVKDENNRNIDIYEADEFGNGNDSATFAFQVLDQHGKGIHLDDAGAIEVKAVSSTNDVQLVAEAVGGDGNHSWDPHYHINVNVADYAQQVKNSSTKSIQYRIVVDRSGYDTLTTSTSPSFTLKLTNVSAYKQSLDTFLALEEGEKMDKTPSFYYNISGGTSSVDLAVKNIINFNNTWSQDLTKSRDIGINYLNANNGMTMYSVPEDHIVPLANKQTTGDAGYVYYKVTTTSATLKDRMGVSVSNGKISVSWAGKTTTASGSAATFDNVFEYAPTGTYKITLYTAKTDGAKLSSKTYTYSVKNTQAEVLFAGYNSELGNETERSIPAEITDADAVEIIKENLVFTLDGKVLDLNNDYVVKDIKPNITQNNKEGSFYVKSVTFIIRLDNGEDNYTYKSEDVKVGKTIKVKK